MTINCLFASLKKKLFIIVIFIFLCTGFVQASEITGQISTNPNNLPGSGDDGDNPGDDQEADIENQPAAGSGIFVRNINIPGNKKNNDGTKEEEIKVLGIKYYPEHSLLRKSGQRIYLIEGNTKKYVSSLKELQAYQGQIIFDVEDEELLKYQTREHLNGDLIREKGRPEIFVIEDSEKTHILNLDELRANFFSQEIFNISTKEIRLYD
jgi:hypothetical protein